MSEIIHRSHFFTARKVGSGLIQIKGLAGERCYLVEGEERALLIDGLTGVGSLKAFVTELTDKPIMMVATHGHLDHTGAAWEYGEVFMHPDDIALMYSPMHAGAERRLDFALLFVKFGLKLPTQPTMADVIPAVPIKTYPVYDGSVFALGGRTLEVIHVPGHTRGSIVLLDRQHRIVFGGDGLNANTLLNLEGSASVEEYRESLQHLKTYQEAFDGFWNGHDEQMIPGTIVEDGLLLTEKILTRTDAAIPNRDLFGGDSLIAADIAADGKLSYGGLCNIQYKLENIHKRETPVIAGRPNL